MGFFKRKKDEEIKIQLEREALDKLNSSTTDAFQIDNTQTNSEFTSGWQISGKIKAPHTITAEELNAKAQKNNTITTQNTASEPIPMEKSDAFANESPANFLYQKMMQSRAVALENTLENSTAENVTSEIDEENTVKQSNENPEPPIEKVENSKQPALDINEAINDLKNMAKTNGNVEENDEIISNDALLDNIDSVDCAAPINDNISTDVIENDTQSSKPTQNTTEDDFESIGTNAQERRATLLARCNAFLEDASVPAKANSEKYKLESVESILKDFEERAAERANKLFNSSATTSNVASVAPTTANTTPLSDVASKVTENTIVFETTPFTKPEVKPEFQHQKETNTTEVKHIFTASIDSLKSPSDFEDISSTKILEDISSSSTPNNIPSSANTAVFPIVKQDAENSDKKENDVEEDNSLQNEETIKHIDDYTNIKDRQRILNSLTNKKKTFLFKTIISFVAAVFGLVALPPISNKFGLTTATSSVLDVLICVLISIFNFNIFPSILTLFTKKQKNASPAALSLIIATIFAIVNLICKQNLIGFSAVAAFTVFSYNLANKNFYSKTIKNFNLIANSEIKKAVSIIQNKNATKAVVGNSIDGSALICYGGETTNIHNFLKYTYCKNPISVNIQKISVIGIAIGIGLAIASLILNVGNLLFPFYVFAAAVCFTSLPAVYHIVSLTINSANKRLNHYDAMITGYRAADELELCNGIALSSDSLFPDGTIRLVDMKLLSPNPFDQSMLDAAAIATAINSPIAGIFNQIDASKNYKLSAQEVDSVIYEEKMGISGWVNDRRVFVGNRDLLIAHGFSGLPPAELDKKIMRKGYFPIYIASDNILCALLIVKYEPDEDIVYEMQRLANTGTTILVDNCDPNICSKMLADYFGLYDETIFVMSKQGSDYYKALIAHKEHRHAGAAFTSCIEGFLATLTASINIKKYITRMTVFYVVGVVLGLLALTASIFTSLVNYITPLNILLVQALFTAITLLPTVLKKP